MKRSLAALCSVLAGAALAQTDLTDQRYLDTVKDAVYDVVISSRSDNYSEDLKTYFFSDKFRQDLSDKKWGGRVDVVVDGVPFGIGADFSESELTVFRERIRSSTSLLVTHASLTSLFQRTGRADIINKINEYFIARYGSGFTFTTSSAGPKGDLVNVSVRYQKKFNSDPMPVLQSLEVLGGTDVRSPLTVGQPVPDQFIISFQRDPTVTVSIALNTTREAGLFAVPADDLLPSDASPVGTIIASLADFQQFSAITRNNERSPSGPTNWTARFSKWAPADGREVSGSKYHTLLSRARLPDLRGSFMRALNEFDPAKPEPPVTAQQADPDSGRRVGSFQPDAFANHTHTVGNNGSDTHHNVVGGGAQRYPHYGGTDVGGGHAKTTTSAGNAPETRPKNVAVYFYVRIN